MKLFLIAIFIAFGTICTNSLIAVDCEVDGCTLESSTFSLLTQYAGCYCQVNFSYCIDNNGIRYLRIDEIIPLTASCTPSGVEMWIRLAALKVLATADFIFDVPDPETYSYTVNLKIPSCMKFENNVITPCDDEKCCEVVYTLKNFDGCPTVMNDVSLTDESCTCSNPGPGYWCKNACNQIIFPKDTCLKIEYSDCDWGCPTNSSGTFMGEFDSTEYSPGYVIPWTYWGLYGGDNDDDTLCIRINEIIYYPGGAEYDDEHAFRRAIQIALWHLYIDTWGYDRTNTHYIRVTMPSCYRSVSAVPYGIALLPCFATCCATMYQVMMLGNDMYVTDYNHDSDPDPLCGEGTGVCSITPCVEEVYANNIRPAPSDSLLNINDINKNGFQTFVKPNPSKDYVNIYLLSQKKGSFHTSIFNLRGEEVYSYNVEKNGYESIYRLNIADFSSGFYFYRIMESEKVIATGQFLISR